MDRIEGAATPEGTHAFAHRSVRDAHASASHFRTTREKLTLSSIGLGTYLGRPDGPTDLLVEQSVAVLLGSGRGNVVDTAINYRSQRAERSVGRQLQRLVERKAVARSEVFVATKVGYLAPDGEDPRSPSQWVQEELVGPGVLAPEEIAGGSHSLAPAYLRDQIERSRSNLGLETIDLLYLHNAAEAQLGEVDRPKFVERLTEAFRTLEEERRQGHLARYGLATWDSLRTGADDPGYVSVAELIAIAEGVGGPEHGLRALQFPFNLQMPEALTFANQPAGGQSVPLFAAAHHWGLTCFTSVPLLQGRLARGAPTSAKLTPAQSALQFARSAPGATCALVGQKAPSHLSENLALSEIPPWSEDEVARSLSSRAAVG